MGSALPSFFVTGLPGAGKSDLGAKGYFEISFNGEDPVDPGDALRRALRERFVKAFAQGDARSLVAELKRVSGSVVAEWGFPINEPCLAFARSIGAASLPVVWLECPDGVARRRFCARDTVPESAFDVQAPMIRANYAAIMASVRPVVVDVVAPDGRELTTEQTFGAIIAALSEAASA